MVEYSIYGLLASISVFLVYVITKQGKETTDALKRINQDVKNELKNRPETDSAELLGRIEAVERRMSELSGDVNRHLQKAAIRERRARRLEGLDDEEEEETATPEQIREARQAMANMAGNSQENSGTDEEMLDQIRARIQRRN